MKFILSENLQQLSDYQQTLVLNSEWSIYEHAHNTLNYHINSYDLRCASRYWKQSLSTPLVDYSSNILLINDGDQVFYNSYAPPSIATILDPYAYTLTQYKNYLPTTDFLNITDSLGHKRKLTLLDMTYKEAVEDECIKNKYSLIFLNVRKQEEVDIKILEQLFLSIEDYGFFCIQINSTFFNTKVKNTLDHYFTLISSKFRTTTTGVSENFIIYRKIPYLI